jgi:hypothetical protein
MNIILSQIVNVECKKKQLWKFETYITFLPKKWCEKNTFRNNKNKFEWNIAISLCWNEIQTYPENVIEKQTHQSDSGDF